MIKTHSKVELLRTDGTDLDVANSARVSFDKESDWDVDPYGHSKLSERDSNLIGYLARHNHWTPFGHVGAQFRVKAPVFVARQLVKHSVGLVWNEVSRRYVDSEPEYLRMQWRWAAENVKQGSAGAMDAESSDRVDEVFWEAVEHSDRAYCEMLQLGVAPEQARAVLCLNHMTDWIWTGSLAAWARVCKLRLDFHAQGEVRDVAQRFNSLLTHAFPVSWAALMGSAK